VLLSECRGLGHAAVAMAVLGLRCELQRRIGLDAVWGVGQELTASTPHLQATWTIEHGQNGIGSIGSIGSIGAAVWRIGNKWVDVGRHREGRVPATRTADSHETG
jgi:hypothetical protein